MTEDGQVVDWKKKYKVKKLEGFKKAERIQELVKYNENLEKEVLVKDRTIQRMANMGMTEYTEKGQKPVNVAIADHLKLESEISLLKETQKELKDIVDEKDLAIVEYVKEIKGLKSKVLELYSKVKNSSDTSRVNTAQIESLISEETQQEIERLHKRIAHLERETRDLLEKLTQKQNDYETMIQRCNLLQSNLDTSVSDLKFARNKLDSLNSAVAERDKRIQTLTTERSDLSSKIQQLQYQNLEGKYDLVSKELVESLKKENELFKKMLKNVNIQKASSSTSDVVTLQKREIEHLKEIDSLKQKIYSYKQMLKEYDILLSIFKERSEEDGQLNKFNMAVDIDDVKIEELMDKVKTHIQS